MLQQFLADEGLYDGPITATFGTLARNALAAFQQQEGIMPASGVFGSLSRFRANEILDAHPDWTTQLSNGSSYTNVSGNPVHSPAYSSNGVPAGATAECRDGTYSFGLHDSGTCAQEPSSLSFTRKVGPMIFHINGSRQKAKLPQPDTTESRWKR
jgi:hypothetical protein